MLGECQKLNGFETVEYKVTLGYKLPAKYVFHTVRLGDKNDCNLNGCYESCLQKVLAYNVKSTAFFCRVIGISGFDPREAAKMALGIVRLWLELNHSSIDCVIFCTHENAEYEIYKDLLSTVYFPVSKYHLTDSVVNVKSNEISNKQGQNLSGLQICPNLARNSESESVAETSKRISMKLDFSVIIDQNILLGVMNYGINFCFFNSVIEVLYSLPLFRDYINKLQPPVKEVAMKIRKLFSEIETASEPVRTFNYMRYLGLQHYEPGMQYDPHEYLPRLLAKIYTNIDDDCIFKINKLESTLCNDCGHTAVNDGACIDWSLYLENSNNVEKISGISHQRMHPRGEYLEST